MSELSARMEALEPGVANGILCEIARQRLSSRQADEVVPDVQLATELAAALGTSPAPIATDDDLAKASLLLLADDPEMRSVIDSMIDNPPAESFAFDPFSLTIGVGAMIVLQSYIKFERDKNGKWTFKFEKKPLTDKGLGNVVGLLSGLLKGS